MKKYVQKILIVSVTVFVILIPASANSLQISPIPNSGFETGDLTNWNVECIPTGANCDVWSADVDEDYAFSGDYGLRLFNANNFWWSSLTLKPKNRFIDGAEVYSIPMKLVGGAETFWSGVVITIYDSQGYVEYRGNINGNVFCWPNQAACKYFTLTNGVWKEYTFNFKQDYYNKYGQYPDSDRTMRLIAYQDTDYVEIYIDNIFGLPLIPATIDIKPDTLNTNSKGKWITAYIEFPEGYQIEDVDCSTIMLEGVVPANSCKLQSKSVVGDDEEEMDGNEITYMMIKFERRLISDLLEPGDEIELTLTGKLIGSTPFEGSDVIMAIDKGRG